MDSDDGRVYMIRGESDAADEADEWVSPEPAEDVITDAIADATDLAADDIGPLEEYVDAADLEALLNEGDRDELSFELEGYEVSVTSGGDIDVSEK